jgi:pyruvate carboxylase subunit B
MPGLVLRVNVEVGQSVDEGAGLVVLEAMKMENEIRAPSAGEITEICVEPGEVVEKGLPLVEIGPAPR